ncbi:hypothetical protein LCM4577_32325 [Mesorhizobium sp. LCM 4577]|nr:hypothetical protein LCM4577_32325 [Mesorhizobium sp. LCM 4577]
MLARNLDLQCFNALTQFDEACCHGGECNSDEIGKVVHFIFRHIQGRQQSTNPLRHRDAEFFQMRANCIGQHSSLPDQKNSAAMQHQNRLLSRCLHGNEAHVRPRHRFPNGFGIGDVIFVAFDVGLYIGRRHQTNRVPKSTDLASPVMRRCTGFNANEARWKFGEILNNLRTAKASPDANLAFLINAMNLKNVLGQIKPDRGNLHCGCSLLSSEATAKPYHAC